MDEIKGLEKKLEAYRIAMQATTDGDTLYQALQEYSQLKSEYYAKLLKLKPKDYRLE